MPTYLALQALVTGDSPGTRQLRQPGDSFEADAEAMAPHVASRRARLLSTAAEAEAALAEPPVAEVPQAGEADGVPSGAMSEPTADVATSEG